MNPKNSPQQLLYTPPMPVLHIPSVAHPQADCAWCSRGREQHDLHRASDVDARQASEFVVRQSLTHSTPCGILQCIRRYAT